MKIYDDGVYKVIEISKEKLQNIDLTICISHTNIKKGVAYLTANHKDVIYINEFLNIDLKIWDDITFDYFKLVAVDSNEDEYLKWCRELADKERELPVKLTPTVHKSPAYIKLLTYAENLKNQEAYLLARLKEADSNQAEAAKQLETVAEAWDVNEAKSIVRDALSWIVKQ